MYNQYDEKVLLLLQIALTLIYFTNFTIIYAHQFLMHHSTIIKNDLILF